MKDFSEHVGDKIRCKKCGVEFDIYSKLDRHLNKEHGILALAGMGNEDKKSNERA